MSVVKVLLNAHFYKVFDKGTVFCSGFVIQCQECTCAGWLWEGEGGLGDHQPGVYVPLKALFLVSVILGQSKCFLATDRYWVTLFQSYWDRANAFLLQTGTG